MDVLQCILANKEPITKKCPPGMKKCPGCPKCVRTDQFCDGVRDCDDGFDEADYICGKIINSSFSFSSSTSFFV